MNKLKETDFMSEIEAVRQMRPSRISFGLLFVILSLLISFFVWANLSKVEILVRGSGAVVPTKENQIIQSLEGGILSEKLVSVGDKVLKDQILMRINDVGFASEERGTEAKFASLNIKRARLIAETNGNELIVNDKIAKKYPEMSGSEWQLYNSRQSELKKSLSILDNKTLSLQSDIDEVNSRIKKVKSSLYLLRKELKITKDMVAKKAVSKLEEIRLEREVSDLNGTIRTLREQIKGLEADKLVSIEEKDYQKNTFITRALGELTEVEADIEGLKESLKSIGDRVDRTELRSPIDGIVNKIAIKTIGGIIEPAMKLIEIVPIDDDLKIIAKISPNDIAFIKQGLPVKVKISAYDPQKYGALDGELVRIAANSTSDNEGNVFFEIEVRTKKNYLGSKDNGFPVTSGMLADIEIITGKRTIMEYLSKPFLRLKDRALTER